MPSAVPGNLELVEGKGPVAPIDPKNESPPYIPTGDPLPVNLEVRIPDERESRFRESKVLIRPIPHDRIEDPFDIIAGRLRKKDPSDGPSVLVGHVSPGEVSEYGLFLSVLGFRIYP